MSTSAPEQTEASIQLRAHHLLCALTFRGGGYGPDFVQAFKQLIDQLNAGAAIQLTCTADQLCAAPQNCGMCKQDRSARRDHRALSAMQQTTGLHGSQAFTLEPSLLAQLRRGFDDGSLRGACADCAWFDLCSSVAAENFRRARLQLSA